MATSTAPGDDPNRYADEIWTELGPQYGRAAYAVETWPYNAAPTAIAISIAENQAADTNAMPTNKDGSTDVGLWQINTKAHPDYPPQRLTEPGYNAAVAYKLSNGGDNWQPWVTFTSGAYKKYLGIADKRGATVLNLRAGGKDAIRLAGVAQKRPLTLDEVRQLSRLAGSSKGHPDVIDGNTVTLMSSKATPDERVYAVSQGWLDAGAAVPLPTGIPVLDDAIGAAGDVIGGVVNGAKGLYDGAAVVLRTVTDPAFWKRAGLVLAGVVLVAGAGFGIYRSIPRPITVVGRN